MPLDIVLQLCYINNKMSKDKEYTDRFGTYNFKVGDIVTSNYFSKAQIKQIFFDDGKRLVNNKLKQTHKPMWVANLGEAFGGLGTLTSPLFQLKKINSDD